MRSSASEVSCSKVSAVLSSIVSSAPDSSPTWIICSARRGKTLPLASAADRPMPDRKSTRLNSSHANISYAVFCLKKKKHQAAVRAGIGSDADCGRRSVDASEVAGDEFAREVEPCAMPGFFFNDTATTEIYTLSLHDALPI